MAKIGLTGLGTMGAALALNIAEKGFSVAVHNRSANKIAPFIDAAGPIGDNLEAAEDPAALAAALDRPRMVIVMVPAGEAVDATIAALLPHLEPGDLIVDAGNANFRDTRRREAELGERGIDFIGMGVSGGEDGARHGPSIMVGGPAEAFERLRPVVEAIAARYRDEPCAAWLGPDGAGHFVKTVHNGIEYADMQLIAETYGMLRHGQGRAAEEIGELFTAWNMGPLQSYLVEITGRILAIADPETKKPFVDLILDRAGQKGTGRWTVIEALTLGESATMIEAAVAARSWSSGKEARTAGAGLLPAPAGKCHPVLDTDLEEALLAARIIAYAQGFGILRAASEEFGWDVDLALTAEIWRAGCIIRSALLDDIAKEVRDGPPHDQLIFAPYFVRRLEEALPALRRVVTSGLAGGLPMPAMASALGYFDTMRTARGTTDLVQAQRDFFGRHGFERVDRDGIHHGPWSAV